MNPDTHDDIDRRIVHALQIDARAPFARIAAVLGVSDQTVARRYARLRAAGKLRVAGLPHAGTLGESWWTLRLECVPGTAAEMAKVLARREDTLWVSLLSGGAELSFAVRSAWGEAPLLDRLPRTRRVVRMTAHQHLHTFFGGPLSLVNKSGALTAGQAERLRPQPADPDPAGPLGPADLRLLAELRRDGRMPVNALARATGWSPSQVRRRLAALRADGTVYFDVEYDFVLFGLGVRAALWLSVPPSLLASTGAALADHPEVAFCTATTGPSNLFAVAVCSDIPALYTYLTTRVAALPGVERMETLPVTRTVKGVAPVGSLGPAGAPGRLTCAGAAGRDAAGGSA
ncbi:AsnC family transcriptional regulator [Streptomyces sp. 6N223]|uniref:AsnC family transcriptional regulator n=1 Tax=Streptomyces sp. 6N223 TaxID=3457412 RepID=UPI003FD3D927